MKNILIILTGGTFGMEVKANDKELSPAELTGDWIINIVPELKKLANITWVSIFNLDSSDMSPKHWDQLGKMIQNKYNEYDGFVIVHGTDTMAYSATALSFIMKETEKPVIFTGSQKPLKSIRTDARNNLIGAVELASMGVPEIGIFFNDVLLRGNRTTKISTEDYSTFYSYNFPPLAKIGVKTDLKKLRLKKASLPNWKFGFDNEIIVLKMFPGFQSNVLGEISKNDKIKAVIIEGFGAGNIPELNQTWLDLIDRFTKHEKLVVVTTQCVHGHVDLRLYKNGKKALDVGAIDSNDMTTEAVVVKLMFALKHVDEYVDLLSFMQTPYCGEMQLKI